MEINDSANWKMVVSESFTRDKQRSVYRQIAYNGSEDDDDDDEILGFFN